MNRTRDIAAGIFFIVAAVTAVLALALYSGVLQDPATASATDVRIGAFLEVLLVISVIGTAVALYPVVSPYGPSAALGYVAGRTIEGAAIMVGAMSLLVAVTVPTAPDVLVALHDWTFLFGPGLAIGVNTLLLASLMWRSRLVPRGIAGIGLVGGPLVFLSSTAVLFGAYTQVSPAAGLFALPVFAWEMSLAYWLIRRGTRVEQVVMVTRTLDRGGVA